MSFNDPPADRAHLQAALEEARLSLEAGDWPIGAVLVGADGGAVIGRARNTQRTGQSRLYHAELQLLLTSAARVGQDEGRLTVYSSLEPCVMCLSALILARVRRIVWACGDPSGGGQRLIRLDEWSRARSVTLAPEPFPDLKQTSRDYVLAYLERSGDEEKARLFRNL